MVTFVWENPKLKKYARTTMETLRPLLPSYGHAAAGTGVLGFGWAAPFTYVVCKGPTSTPAFEVVPDWLQKAAT
jgi:hypothetical protein